MKRSVVLLFGVIILLIVVGGAFYLRRKPVDSSIHTAPVIRTDVVQEVSFTGRLEAKETAALGFETSGAIRNITVSEGDFVQAGQQLARIDARDSSLEVARARADRASSEQSAYLTWQKSETDWNNAKAENTKMLAEQQQRVRNTKAEMDQAYGTWQTRADEEGEGSFLAQTAYSTYLAAKNAYASAQKSLETLQKTIEKGNDAARAATEIAKEQYIATQQASGVLEGASSLEVAEQLARVRLAKTVLTSPLQGVVTDIAVNEGEFATAGQAVMTIQTVSQLEVAADTTETDAIQLTAGTPATITLDAFARTENWQARVRSIAPAARIIEGLPTYEVIIELLSVDTRLKPGLTANVTVHVEGKKNVLAIPRRAIITQGQRQFVRVQGADSFIAEYEVTTGLIGSDGLIEVTSGVSEGQNIVVRSEEQ
ncbi:MAG: efflux RND transporter periplasmic adaptor subunit [Candidatus Andersenbacteria bacterium]